MKKILQSNARSCYGGAVDTFFFTYHLSDLRCRLHPRLQRTCARGNRSCSSSCLLTFVTLRVVHCFCFAPCSLRRLVLLTAVFDVDPTFVRRRRLPLPQQVNVARTSPQEAMLGVCVAQLCATFATTGALQRGQARAAFHDTLSSRHCSFGWSEDASCQERAPSNGSAPWPCPLSYGMSERYRVRCVAKVDFCKEQGLSRVVPAFVLHGPQR